MNGFSCNTPSLTQSTCRPGCATSGLSLHRTWWAFISQGGNVSITLNVGNCIINNGFGGLCWGIFGDCQCTEEIKCVPWYLVTNQSETYQMNLKPCKIYYMFLDSGDDNCDFTISTSGGGPPNLFLGHINNVSNDIIEPVCQGYCGYHFFVDQGGCLEANYEWTLDGNKVGGSKSDIKLDFPVAGDFKLCVTATLGNPNNGSICAMQGPTCTTIKVRPIPDKNGAPRTICYESANPKGYKWLSQTIYTSGIYREHYQDNNCCPYDSVVQFKILDKPNPHDVYYITCDNKPYVDMLGRRWAPCRDQWIIDLPMTDGPLKCDSSIRLTAINVDFAPQWQAKCLNGKVELSPNVNIVKKCDVGESYDFEYRWYKKNDTLQKTITTDEHLVVDSVSEDYCIEIKVKVRLGTTSAICEKTFCDSINESQVKSTFENRAITLCDSAKFNGQTYSQDTQFTQQLKNIYGCDSIVNTQITIQKSSTSYLSLNACDSVVLNNQVYYQSGKYSQILVNANNCDSILNLDLTIGQSRMIDLNYQGCDSIAVHGQTYYQSGTYTLRFTSPTGCDSILNLQINLEKSSKTDLDYKGCDSVVVNGKVYTSSGDYSQLYQSVFGCDSLLGIHVAIANSTVTAIKSSYCDSADINGTIYMQSGQYTQYLKTVDGCDSLLQLDLSIAKSSQSSLQQKACDSTIINNRVYTTTGVYKQLLTNANGCDSILNLDLQISNSSKSNFSFDACDSVQFNGRTYYTSGDYTQKYTAANGCDSILAIHVNIPNSNITPVAFNFCDSVTINGRYYNQSGNYTQKLISTKGCDSLLTIDLTIAKSNASIYKLTSCDSALINGQWYLQSGNYTQLLQNAAHCDSSLNIDLTIAKSNTFRLVLANCDSVNVNNQFYTTTGVYKQLLTNANGCDSVLTVDYTRLNATSASRNYQSCDSIRINGQKYSQSGNYTQTLVNAAGCDSILNLQIDIEKSTQADYRLSSCDSARINGNLYTQTGMYMQRLAGAAGCDSIVNIDLTILKGASAMINVAACDSAIVNNRVYKTTGMYNQILRSTNGCDSSLDIQANIARSTASVLALTRCDSVRINNQFYTQTGIYKQLLTNTSGCDSTLTLDLTIKPGNPSILDAGADTSICQGEIISLNGIFSGTANFIWHSQNGILDNPHNQSTHYYSTSIGDDRIYLQASDDCKQWLDSLDIHVLPKQIVQVTGDTLVNPCKELSFTASGGTNYIWTPSSYIECLDPPCSRVILKSTANTRFTISTDGPCAVPANLNLSVSQIQTDIYLPNAFSPNGDNINDVFLPVFNCDQIDSYDLQIFDRWGNLLFESTNKDHGWDGKSQNIQMNPGVYPYLLQYQIHGSERKLKAGELTLIR
jgi:gliding motility-associated-like protein